MSEVIATRKKLLLEMDNYVRNVIGDDEITVNIWLRDGLPDCCDEETLHFIAIEDSCWFNCVEAFEKCCKAEFEEEEGY